MQLDTWCSTFVWNLHLHYAGSSLKMEHVDVKSLPLGRGESR